jgi:uncharacterized protein with FMN-binding domain
MFPKRGAVAIGLTGLALALLLSFKTPSETTALSGSTGSVAVADPSTTTTQTTSGTGTSGSTSATAAPEAATAPAGTAAPAATTAPAATATPASGAATSGTFTGDAVSTRFGVVQVQVTIESGKIVDVTALSLPANDPHSAMISQRVESTLRSSALAAQSAQIDLVSGATYTSMGYAQSLQAALDQAGL